MRNFDYAVVGKAKRYKDGTKSFISLLDSNNFFRLNFNHSREEQISKALRWAKLFLELSDLEMTGEALHVGFYCDRRLYFVAELNQTKPN